MKMIQHILLQLPMENCPIQKQFLHARTIDVWGMNVYRWDNPEGIFQNGAKISSKPMYLSEAGADSYMVVDPMDMIRVKMKKRRLMPQQNILDDIFRYTEICSGVALFAFVDELWKAGNNNAYRSWWLGAK